MDSDTLEPLIRLVCIVGPTAVGKTRVALEMAQAFGAEIVNADSMQVYRYMNIGTAKPSVEEMQTVRHHLLDIADPDEDFNAARFVEEADRVIAGLAAEGKSIFVVGGTGLYIRALLGGLIDGPQPDEAIRNALKNELRLYGKKHLYQKLERADSQAALNIHPNDAVRIVRALEVIESSGESLLKMQARHRFKREKYEYIKLGLSLDKDLLYKRIEGRADKMIADGLVEEVSRLIARGYDESCKPMRSLGYKHILAFHEGVLDFSEAVRLLKRDTRKYAKRQITWFKRESDIAWFDTDDCESMRKRIESFLGRG